MSGERAQGRWVPLMDYATQHNISLSTLRRHIKADKVDYKLENGRYFLWDDKPVRENGREASSLEHELRETLKRLNQAQNEIAELKTLIAFYEESTQNTQSP